ncbi:FG-GAP repeat domain-containing protein [Methylobrevis pamukkalensis]|uniref:FG-GAP repeat protein n=1 Tax=Methylobrevis pamukkalensis TaxID=1439726 RepID=A0A1E3H6G7_9HYPH|nr:hypothetical protein A6302_00761 [Methylobrevis pamukkalensis]
MHEEATTAGVHQVYDGPWEFFVGGGVASFDCNGDLKPDMFMAGGRNPAKLFVNESPVGGALKFRESPTGLDERDGTKVLGAYPLDIDGDGHMDLAVLRLGENLLLKGAPGCRFEVANRAFGFDGGRAWTTAFAAEWERGQRFPTLAFGNYVDRAQPGSPWGTCHDNELFRPEAGESPRYGERTVLTPGFCTLSMLFTDWNRSGEPSLRMTNDRQYYRGGQEQLWAVPPGKPPRLYGKADGWEPLTIWGMGIAQFDLDVDGAPEYALTSMGDTKLQTLDDEAEEDRPVYRDIAFEKGATAHRPTPGRTSIPRPAGTRNLPTSTTTALPTSSSPRATSRRCRTLPPSIPTTCCSAAGTAALPKPANRPASRSTPRAAARASPTSISTACSIWWWSTAASRPACSAIAA